MKYTNRYYDLVPYIKKNKELYTSFDESNPEDKKEMKKFEAALHTELHHKSLFWDTFFVRITGDDLILNPGEYDGDALTLRWLRGHKDAKTSPRQNKANAVFVIVDEQEEAKVINERGQIKTAAIVALNKMTVDEKRSCLRLYGFDYDGGSAEVVDAKMFELVDDNPSKFKRMWMDDQLKFTKVLIQRAMSKGILRRKGKSIFCETTPLGSTVDEAAVELDKNENAQLKSGIKKGLGE